jgi:hypothetical protein
MCRLGYTTALMALAKIRADDVKLGGSIFQHHQNFDRIAEIVVM